MEWQDVHGYFAPNLSPPLDDHRSIPPYRLHRARLPIALFKSICGLLNESRKTLGRREDLATEAAVQLKYNPIPSTLLGLFDGRLTNLPEPRLVGQIGSSGRCEFTIAFHNLLVLCFVEYEQGLPTGVEAHSDVVAQIIAEMDGADTFNQNGEIDGIRIQAILTDGVIFEFYAGDFKDWTIHREIGLVEEGIPYEGGYQITLPQSEKAPDYLAKLKVVVEVVFDSFLTSSMESVSKKVDRNGENGCGRMNLVVGE